MNLKESSTAQALELLALIVRSIVDRPADARITATPTEDGTTLTVVTHPDDVGRVIGRQGQTAKAIRVVMAGVGMKSRTPYTVVVSDRVVQST